MRELGICPYEAIWERMREFTRRRTPGTEDELWLLQHHQVYTLGQAARREHLLSPGTIPVVQCDRGGQVTYHGPGQLIVYTLLDLRRAGLGVRSLVQTLEQSVIDLLASQGVTAAPRAGAPGVYVDGRKVCALGLRVRGGCAYHGLALNVDVDLAPFRGIDPCGYRDLEITRTRDLGIPWNVSRAGRLLARALARRLGSCLVTAGPTTPVATGS